MQRKCTFSSCQTEKDMGPDIIRALSKKVEEAKANRKSELATKTFDPTKKVRTSLGLMRPDKPTAMGRYCLHDNLSRSCCEPDEAADFTHKLTIVVINISGNDYGDYDETIPLKDYYNDILDEKYDCERSTWVQLFRCSVLEEELDNRQRIKLKAYVPHAYESDTSHTTYVYDTTLKCWVEEDGVNDHGHVVVLDFSGYNLADDNPKP